MCDGVSAIPRDPFPAVQPKDCEGHYRLHLTRCHTTFIVFWCFSSLSQVMVLIWKGEEQEAQRYAER